MTERKASQANLMPIGRFSTACRLSVKALRHYDEIGLLTPAYTDPDSGYRYYGADQARDAVLIAMLRSMDMPLATIQSLLSADTDVLRDVLAIERARVENEVTRQKQILNSIERITREGNLTPYRIGIRVEPDYRLASMHCETRAEDMVRDASDLMYRLFDELQRAGIEHQAPYLCINEAPEKDGNMIVRACTGFTGEQPAGDGVETLDVPGGPVASLLHIGSYDELGLAYHALSAWTQERGHQQRDALREIYRNDPANTPTEALETEVLLPIQGEL